MTSTIRTGIVDTEGNQGAQELLIYGMLPALLAAGAWRYIASRRGWPVSTTRALVGAVLGVGMARRIDAIDLSIVGRIFLSWVVTIPAGAILAIVFFFTFRAVLP